MSEKRLNLVERSFTILFKTMANDLYTRRIEIEKDVMIAADEGIGAVYQEAAIRRGAGIPDRRTISPAPAKKVDDRMRVAEILDFIEN
jgi:hypothetical protein